MTGSLYLTTEVRKGRSPRGFVPEETHVDPCSGKICDCVAVRTSEAALSTIYMY